MYIQVIVDNFDNTNHRHTPRVKPISNTSPIADFMNYIVSVIKFKEDVNILPTHQKSPKLEMNKIKSFDNFMYQEKLDSPV